MNNRNHSLAQLCLFLGALAVGTATPLAHVQARGDAPVAVGKYEEWHGLDKVEIVQPFQLAGYQSVVVEPVETKGAKLPDKGDNTYEPILKVLGDMTKTFANGVKEKAKLPVAEGKAAGGAGVLIVRARVLEIRPGSQAARVFGGIAGSAASAASVGLAGEVLDGKTKRVLFRFEQTRRSGFNSQSGFVIGGMQIGGENPYVRLLNRSAKEVGNDVGGALRAF